jgi:hypothetical protein
MKIRSKFKNFYRNYMREIKEYKWKRIKS